MLFTGKGDGGTTKTLSSDKRVSKGSAIAEALGSLDEVNSFLGLVKVASTKSDFKVEKLNRRFDSMVHDVQQTLFIIQAEVAGYSKGFGEEKIKDVEEIINTIEAELPPIKTFFISGGTELAALFDVSRTLARRAERRVVGVHDLVQSGEQGPTITPNTLAYLNRLSSLLYALARLSNHLSGITETPPSYE